ncbi:hypothetical protein BKA70DRAFT_373172 [Coprinopsis sp. MPI-PUGE-AT-0042]|nr:hypothetical protein BKA70DRAFT_373172 [Coprinopsis sp. MPI-PUGE-AT-0042]
MLSVKQILFAITSAAWLVNAAPAPAMDLESYAAATAACSMVAESSDLSPAWSGTSKATPCNALVTRRLQACSSTTTIFRTGRMQAACHQCARRCLTVEKTSKNCLKLSRRRVLHGR